MSVFPVALRLDGRLCLVVGSGQDAVRRTRDLLEAGARVRLVAEEPGAPLRELVGNPALTLEERGFAEQDLDGVWLAVLAERNPVLAEQLGAAAEQRQLPLCAVDQPEHNTFSHMARARAGTVQAAISTSGTAPALARRLAEELQRLFDDANLAALADELSQLRELTASRDRADGLGQAVAGVHVDGQLELGRART